MNCKYYFISKFETNNINKQDKQTVIIFRNYSNFNVNEKLILKIKKHCKKRGVKFYLSNNVKLALKLKLDGAYIPSFNRKFNHLNFSYQKKFDIIGSAHNLKEIKIKELQKVNKIFLSSLFKKNKNYLGINRFKIFSKLTKKKVVVLGGVSKEKIKELRLLNNPDFAGISFFE
jgi:thiamine-phosphate pyrophosphorylase